MEISVEMPFEIRTLESTSHVIRTKVTDASYSGKVASMLHLYYTTFLLY